MALDFNTAPYYDDYDKFKNYIRILFRGGHAVQARELTQLQSALQNQISSFADHIFEDGSVVIPGGTFYEPRISYVTLNTDGDNNTFFTDTGLSTEISSSIDPTTEYVGKIIEGENTGVKAKVQKILPASGSDPVTMYIQYISNSTDGETKRFEDGERLNIDINIDIDESDALAYATASASDSTGYGAAFFIEEGVFYLKKAFVSIEKQSIILQKYNTYDPETFQWTNPINLDIGFDTKEVIVTSSEDPSLNDNAQGESNYAAPGAHRYQINPTLIAIDNTVDFEDNDDFTLITRIESGIVKTNAKTPNYALLEETLARRTFDESGNYTVNPFLITIREHLKEGNNDGLLTLEDGGDNSKYIVDIAPSKAYVKGYEVEKVSKTVVQADKARDFEAYDNFQLDTSFGGYVYVEFEANSGIPNLGILEQVQLKNGSTTYGLANVRSLRYDKTVGGTDYYRLYLFNVQIDPSTPPESPINLISGTGWTATPYIVVTNDVQTAGFALIEGSRSGLVFEYPYNQIKSSSSYSFSSFVYAETSSETSVNAISFSGSSGSLIQDGDWIATDGTNIVNKNTTEPGFSYGITGNTITINYTWPAGSYKFIGTERKPSGTRKPLEYISGAETVINFASHYTSYSNGNTAPYFYLGKTNVLSINAVYRANGETPTTTSSENVTKYFTLDTNANDNYYGISKAIKSSNFVLNANDQLLFVFDYLNIGSGDFITLDSYLDEPNQTYGTADTPNIEAIPLFNSSKLGKVVSLGNTVDFRPTVDTSSFSQPTDQSLNVFNPSGYDYNPFNGYQTNPLPSAINSNFESDIEFYLNRIDKLIVNYKGQFGVLQGKSALKPEPPKDREDSMTLYQLYIPAYTRFSTDINFEMVDNKRYTMRDIGKIEKRVQNIEYYTSLNLLEKEAAQKQIKDSSGLDVYKNGFLVDSFVGTNIADAGNPDFNASIDKTNKILRPAGITHNVNLALDTTKSNSNIILKGSQLMLDYTEENSINQPYASSSVSVNPFEVFDWTGTVELSPESDEWKETRMAPAVNYDVDGIYDSIKDAIDETGALGTHWGEWKENWAGAKKSSKPSEILTRENYLGGYKGTKKVYYDITKSREGVKTYVEAKTIKTDLGDRVVDVSFSPYIRSRIIRFRGTRLKPNTRVYIYFEEVNVTDYCVQSDSFSWFGSLYNTSILGYGRNTYTKHPLNSNDPGENVLTTDSNGNINGEFLIPCNDELTFKTGTRKFVIIDSPDGRKENTETVASTNYEAKGLIERSEDVSISIKVPRIKEDSVSSGPKAVTGSKVENYDKWLGYVPATLDQVGTSANNAIGGALRDPAGTVTSWVGGGGGGLFSDLNLKENVTTINNATDKLYTLNGVTFDWTDDFLNKYGKSHGYSNKNDVGLIAQDVYKVMPEAVLSDEDGNLLVQYHKIIALLVESNKELNNKISKLENLINQKGQE